MKNEAQYVVQPDETIRFDGALYHAGDVITLSGDVAASIPTRCIKPYSPPEAVTVSGEPDKTDVEPPDEPLPEIPDDDTEAAPLPELRLGALTVAHLELICEALDIPKQRPGEKKADLLARVDEALTDEALDNPAVQTVLNHIAAEQ